MNGNQKNPPPPPAEPSLADNLHRSLDVDTVLESFADHIGKSVDFDTMLFKDSNGSNWHGINGKTRHHTRFELELEGEELGNLEFGRQHPFEKRERQAIHAMLPALLYPLRNARLYRTAREAAFKDPLTGVNNRAGMADALEREIALAKRYGRSFSIAMLDIDHFKAINDRHGHDTGDKALQRVATIMAECLRGTDMIYRYGGEEFLILMDHTDEEGARQVAERIREAVERSVCDCSGKNLRLSVSLGVAALREGDTQKSLLKRADKALYKAKENGRNRVEVG
jgi:diguanylate cyclase (GGDEF)-like protein